MCGSIDTFNQENGIIDNLALRLMKSRGIKEQED
jgi:hypothetical protein